ncbi:RT0821/Lpp0805 family surface protein [Microvirga terrae]|uniref:RT0821/Lpp0805 family surface protein n=1 Tax=Microvirga terrae TaxID=2740529 RepID=A0ABY5RRG1_9HYPH|nr:RT0821/Lpp0805 family surface protein [Microvirga terrae]UVF18534.1 RT0821/Lpp0805 family surface protein [Microvirga terrae]
MTRINARRYRSDAVRSEAIKLLAVGLIALSTGACSFSFGLSALDDEGPKSTGALAAKAVTPLSADLDEEDWRRAKAALAVALDPQGPGTLVSWDNPATSMKGNFTPMGAPFVKNDEICRTFSAHLSGPSSASLNGTACRPSGGEWAIKDVKPIKAQAKV